MTAEHSALAFTIAYGQLQTQAQDLRATRNGASIAIAFSGLIATSGCALISNNLDAVKSAGQMTVLGVHFWFWVILFLLMASTASAILALTAVRVCNFNLIPEYIISNSSGSIEHLHETLAADANRYFDGNEGAISEAQNYVRWALILSWVQIIPWALVVASGSNVQG